MGSITNIFIITFLLATFGVTPATDTKIVDNSTQVTGDMEEQDRIGIIALMVIIVVAVGFAYITYYVSKRNIEKPPSDLTLSSLGL